MDIQKFKRELELIRSNDRAWLINYFSNQSIGLNELACQKDMTDQKLTNEIIIKARLMRAELLRRFDLVLFANNVMTKEPKHYLIN